jgi:hypothetical protein
LTQAQYLVDAKARNANSWAQVEIEMHATLSLFEDVISRGATLGLSPQRARMIFVVHGSAAIGERTFADGETWHGEDSVQIEAGSHGATCWRWELSGAAPASGLLGPGIASREKLSATLDTMPDGDLLLRGDSVAFPPGGCAFQHTHQGPGIRCLIEGGIRIDTEDQSTSYGPGGAWFEADRHPVFAQAAPDRPSRFIRTMILPRALLGKSSIRYVNDADRDRPKSQQYKIFIDAPIARPMA